MGMRTNEVGAGRMPVVGTQRQDVAAAFPFESSHPRESLSPSLRRAPQLAESWAIYVLIDRVDENDLTGNDAAKAFTFIEPLLPTTG